MHVLYMQLYVLCMQLTLYTVTCMCVSFHAQFAACYYIALLVKDQER